MAFYVRAWLFTWESPKVVQIALLLLGLVVAIFTLGYIETAVLGGLQRSMRNLGIPTNPTVRALTKTAIAS